MYISTYLITHHTMLQDYVCKFSDVRHREISSDYLSKNKALHVLYLIHKRLQGRMKKSVIVLFYKFTYNGFSDQLNLACL